MEGELSTFAKCESIRNGLLIRVGESLSYKEWSPAFKLENIENIHTSVSSWERQHGSFKIDPNDLTEEQLISLGFARWSEQLPIRLIPIWLFPFLAEEFECYSIGGIKYNKKSAIDSDHRMGALAYGVLPKNFVDGTEKMPQVPSGETN